MPPISRSGSGRLGQAALLLWLLTIAGALFVFVQGRTMPASDGRTAVVMSPAERDFVLAEMRGLLGAVRDITAALAQGDAAAAGKAARAMGMHEAHDKNPGLLLKLPLEFKKKALGLHAGFDDFAAAAETGASPAQLTHRLLDLLDRCNGCHTFYALRGVE